MTGRTLSLNFRAAINAAQSEEVPIFLLTIEHDDFETIYLTTDPTARISDVPLLYGTTSRSQIYYFIGMSVTLPDEREGAGPRASFTLGNVTTDIITLVRTPTTPPRAKLELVLASDLDSVEVESPWLDLVSVNNRAGELVFDLTLNSMVSEQWPTDSMDPSGFPGLHAR